MKHFTSLTSDFCWNDFIAGWVGGVAGLLVGHPADTIKVRQQTYGTTLWPSVSRTYKHEGVRGFFKGMLFPLLTTGPINSIFFGFYGNTLHILEEGRYAKSPSDDPRYLQNVFVAGCTGGFATVFFTCPIELVKVVLQAHTEGKATWGADKKGVVIRKGMINCIRQIYKEGGFSGFYRGFVPMLWRDVPSYGVYTWVYEVCLHYVFSPGIMSDVSRQIFAGGLAGTVAWGMCMPFDVVKSRLQADFNNSTYKGTIDCAYKSYKSEGCSIFCKGMIVTCLRAFPVNAATFALYERTIVFCNHLSSSSNPAVCS
ncbi:solute carrier family 25 member 45-like isoform X2 [Onthophagus taurus]|uniref:solute carrier family 25 member 45-like isoform X2 n=1 Tax=Onthophagus taurus TaxID=166361 RepID=UPI0039BE8815